jgi:hypothetical protein
MHVPRPKRLAGQDRPPAHASGRPSAARGAAVPCKLSYQAQSWKKPWRIAANVEWHQGELYARVGLDPLRGSSVTNLARPAERVVACYNHRRSCEQYITEGKSAIKWTRLSCHSFAANTVRLQLHALVYNLGNFMRTPAMPETAEPWSLTPPSLRAHAAERSHRCARRVPSCRHHAKPQDARQARPATPTQ